MVKRKIAGIILAAVSINMTSAPITALANELNSLQKVITQESQVRDEKEAKVDKFSLYGNDKLEAYNNVYKVDNSKIKKITNNGGKYGSSIIEKAIDGDFATHWETGKPNNVTMKNEVVIELDEVTEINRIVYAARQDGAKGKGFAKEFEIYGAETSNQEDLELVARGSYLGSVGDIVEIKFNPTSLKLIKFKFVNAHNEWASAAEFMLYKEDVVSDKMDRLFTDGTMSVVSEEFNSIEKINKLDNEVKEHPLYEDFNSLTNLAKEIVQTGDKVASTTWELESRGDSINESQKRKLWNFQDWQPTGYRVKSGDIVNVYVDVEEGKPTPQIVFKQMDSQHNGQMHINLKNGKNTIVIPERPTEELRPGTVKAGVLYTSNPYTAEEQGRKPKIRIEGAKQYPHYIKGVDSDEEVMKELEKYVELLKIDPTLPDVFDIFSDKTLVNVRATYALDWFKNNNKLPSYTANKSDEVIKETMKYWGFDESSEINSDFNFRYATILKYLDNGGFMNAGNGITGFNQREQGGALDVNTGWGFMHEIGHNFDFNKGSISETTNNMLPLHFQRINGMPSRLTDQNLWEGSILRKVALDDYSQNEHYPEDNRSHLTHLAPLWQLQIYNENFWPQFEQASRRSTFKGGSIDEIHNEWIRLSSDVFKLDLTEHFERHGVNVEDATRVYTSKYKKYDKKTWYVNDKFYLEEGGAFTEALTYSIKSIKKDGENIKLVFDMDKENLKNTLGYEVYRDGEIIGFTAENTFIDKTATEGKNHEYKIVAYDKEITPQDEASAKTFDPSIQAENMITVELNSNFNALDYVIATNYKGESINEDVKVVNNNVDITKKGIYQVTYEITSEGTSKAITSKVEVVSKSDYLSDIKESSAKVGWGSFRKDKSPVGNTITLYNEGQAINFKKGLGAHAASEVIYDIENKGYTTFKAYAGIDGEVGLNRGSATFEVYADGVKVYDSGTVKAGDDYKVVNIDVSGVKQLKLITTEAGNGRDKDNTVWADAKLTTNNVKPIILAEDKEYKFGEDIDLMSGVTAKDAEDGDLTSQITIKESSFIKDTLGNFKVTYEVRDSDGNIVSKIVNITVYDEFDVTKSYYGTIEDLQKYNELFKIPVSSVSNNGGKYGSSVVGKAIDGSIDSHFETGKANSESFRNEVIFNFDELKSLDKMAYASRKGGKGFATKFDVYVSESIEGNDFYKVGEGSYNGSKNDVIEFSLNGISARRVKFVFVEAYQNWASIGEVAFYKHDELSYKIEKDLFVDKEQSDVTESYDTLEKLEKLRAEIEKHPAKNLFEERLNKAEELIRAKFPSLQIPNDISTKLGVKLALDEEYTALDKEDGNITDRVRISGIESINYNKPGTYEVIYTVQDSAGNIASKIRNVHVVDMEDYEYLSDIEWKSTHNSYGRFEKDRAYSKNPMRLTGENNEVVNYSKGLGTHSTGTVIYDLTKIEAQYFTSFVGVDRAMYNTVGSVAFQVFLDGEKVYDSGVMRSTDKQKFVEVELSGAKELKLVMTDGGNGNGSDHGNWADAKLHYANENSVGVDRSELDALLKEIDALKKVDYTTESWNSLMVEVEKVNVSLSDGYNQEEIDTLYKKLKVLKDSLEEVVKYDRLEELIESTKDLKDYLYTNDSWKSLSEAIKKANAIVADKTSTIEQVKSMVAELENSINNLVIRTDKVELEKLINYADSITDISFVGASKHQEARWNNFVIAREVARKALLDVNTTVTESKSAKFQIQYFIDELQMN